MFSACQIKILARPEPFTQIIETALDYTFFRNFIHNQPKLNLGNILLSFFKGLTIFIRHSLLPIREDVTLVKP